MSDGEPKNRSSDKADASELLFEVGRRLQAVALMMRKHQMVREQQICACGRIALRVLPVFGLRCDVACGQWQLAHDSMRQLLAQMTDRSLDSGAGRFVGRARLSSPDSGGDTHSRKSDENPMVRPGLSH